MTDNLKPAIYDVYAAFCEARGVLPCSRESFDVEKWEPATAAPTEIKPWWDRFGGNISEKMARDAERDELIAEVSRLTAALARAGDRAAPDAMVAAMGSDTSMWDAALEAAIEVCRAERHWRLVDAIRALKSDGGRAAPAGDEQQGYGRVEVVGDLVRNLLMLDQALPIYSAFHVDWDGGRRCRTRPVTASLERVIDGKWVDPTRKDVPYAVIVWAKPQADEQSSTAGSAREGGNTKPDSIESSSTRAATGGELIAPTVKQSLNVEAERGKLMRKMLSEKRFDFYALEGEREELINEWLDARLQGTQAERQEGA